MLISLRERGGLGFRAYFFTEFPTCFPCITPECSVINRFFIYNIEAVISRLYEFNGKVEESVFSNTIFCFFLKTKAHRRSKGEAREA